MPSYWPKSPRFNLANVGISRRGYLWVTYNEADMAIGINARRD